MARRMKSNVTKKLLLLLLTLLTIGLTFYACSLKEDETSEEHSNGEVVNNVKQDEKKVNEEKEVVEADEEPYFLDTVEVDSNGYPLVDKGLPEEPTVIDGVLIASKVFPLPKTYNPGESKEARAAFEQMATDAKKEGISLHAFSTFRSYDYQVDLYDRYVKRDGQEAADTYSARPGYSEHQTGLAFDIGAVGEEGHYARNSFATTKAGVWVRDNAHHYGFIMRYPEGKEHITGYMYESWHFRYVGEGIATEIYKRGITLEQYLGLSE
ncbi:M15 family metallopeptidase [Savagea serpentis]|nr:M15 family metallopeptidase [Savagea serpentis]